MDWEFLQLGFQMSLDGRQTPVELENQLSRNAFFVAQDGMKEMERIQLHMGVIAGQFHGSVQVLLKSLG